MVDKVKLLFFGGGVSSDAKMFGNRWVRILVILT